MERGIGLFTVGFILVLGLNIIISSCLKEDPPVMEATSMQLVSGGNQTSDAESTLASPVELLVKDQEGNAFQGATNESGFTALPAGYRSWYNGEFIDAGEKAYFWSSKEETHNAPTSYYFGGIDYGNGVAGMSHVARDTGFSVRCVKD